MPSSEVLQLIVVPLRPAGEEDIFREIIPAFINLETADGFITMWRAEKHEERYTRAFLVLWKSLEASHAFFTGPIYTEFHRLAQPALRGRAISWNTHTVFGHSSVGTLKRLETIMSSPVVEIGLVRVVEAAIPEFYAQEAGIVDDILIKAPGCGGHFANPLVEDPHTQLVLVGWASLDAHQIDFETSSAQVAVDSALDGCLRTVNRSWHITNIRQIGH